MRAHHVQDIPQQELGEFGAVGVEDCDEEAVQEGLPGGCQLPVFTALADVLEDQGHHAVELLCCLIQLQHGEPALSKWQD